MKRFIEILLTVCIFFLFSQMGWAEPTGNPASPKPKKETEITKENIEVLLGQLEKAFKEENIGLLETLFSDDIKIGSGPTKMTKSEYLELQKKGWGASTKTVFIRTRSNVNIEIAKDGRSAVVKSSVSEQSVDNEEYSFIEESLSIEFRNGKTLIVAREWDLCCAKTRDGDFID